MHLFDELLLISTLAKLPFPGAVAFACAAASRQLGNYERAASLYSWPVLRPREIVQLAWEEMSNPQSNWEGLLNEVMDLMPEENENWSIHHSLADDALSSLAYAIRCLRTGDTMEAVWSARRAYEAADQVAIRLLGTVPDTSDAEARVVAHHVVQRELSRQYEDITLLRQAQYHMVRTRALASSLLSDQEVAALMSPR